MSKLFDRIRKSQGDVSLGSPQADQLVEVAQIAGGTEAVPDGGSAHYDLTGCRKVRLPKNSDAALIFQSQKGSTHAAEAYRALRTRVMRLQATGGIRSIVIGSALPGEGKTITSLNLAMCCAQLHEMKVLVIDADLRTRGLTKLLGYPAAPGLAEAIVGKADYESAILSTDVPNLYVLAAGETSVAPPELFASAQWKEFISWCSRSFKLVLVDAPPILSLSDFDLITQPCDGCLVVVRAHRTPRALLKNAASQIDTKKLLGVVYNQVSFDADKHGYRQYHSTHLGKS